MKNAVKGIPERRNIPEKDTWDLSLLYENTADFKADLKKLNSHIAEAAAFKGKFTKTKQSFLSSLKWLDEVGLLSERLGNYAFLNYSTEINNPEYQTLVGMYQQTATNVQAAISFFEPEVLESENAEKWMKEPEFAPYKRSLQKILHLKGHILSDKEEAILAMGAELRESPSNAFEALTDVDMDFGKINGRNLTQSTFQVFLHNPSKNIRRKAYMQFYSVFQNHAETLASLYSSSVKQDIFNARVRNFGSSLDAALYGDNIPSSVYENLIKTVHSAFPELHRYYSLKKKICGLDELNHYDAYLPMARDIKKRTTYEDACKIVKKALAVLGSEYTDTLYNGLTRDRWADVYENKGKRSGAFSSGGYIGNPYILLNYQEGLIGDVFTIAHEGGHSMHTYYSKQNNPFSCYNYTIFEAEVASTFNETLLFDYLIENEASSNVKKYLISKQLDDIVATLFRQTMFAEFELVCHRNQEEGKILTLSSIREIYRDLLRKYFGDEMVFEECSDLECLRIPHFYNAFYVYKYATGISAAISLVRSVKENGNKKYLEFLKSGGSKWPLESLRLAGVDMSKSKPIKDAILKFSSLLDAREKLM